MRRVEGDCHDLYLGESHGFRGSSQLRPWGAGILNKPKNRSCHLPPTANFTFTPIFHQKFLLKFLPDLLWNRIFSLSFALELNFKRGDIWVWSETIFLHGALSCIVIWELHFLPLNTPCISLLVWYLLIIFSIGALSTGIWTQVMGGNQPVDC